MPSGIAVTSSGTLYVSDRGNGTIRQVTSAGVVTTLAGTAGGTTSVDGTGSAASFSVPFLLFLRSNGNLLVAEWGAKRIREVTSAGVVSTLLTGLDAPVAVVGTGSQLYISENPQQQGASYQIRKWACCAVTCGAGATSCPATCTCSSTMSTALQ